MNRCLNSIFPPPTPNTWSPLSSSYKDLFLSLARNTLPLKSISLSSSLPPSLSLELSLSLLKCHLIREVHRTLYKRGIKPIPVSILPCLSTLLPLYWAFVFYLILITMGLIIYCQVYLLHIFLIKSEILLCKQEFCFTYYYPPTT
jgi:hypothetical protein